MPDLAPIICRFNEHEFEIRRRYARDPEFRAICEDYSAATRALLYWEKDRSKAEDYRQLIRELEDEILAHLTDPRRSAGDSPAGRR
jgi:hypothetical protein